MDRARKQQSTYDARAGRAYQSEKKSRRDRPFVALANAMNAVKYDMINAIADAVLSAPPPVPPFALLDLACGPANDLRKWSRVATRMVGLDASEKAIRAAQSRVAAALVPPSRLLPRHVDYRTMDLRTWTGTGTGSGSGLGPELFDAVSIQLAIHYMWRSRDSARAFLSRAAERVGPNGYFICSFIDSAKLWEVAREHPADRRFGLGNLEFEFPADSLAALSVAGGSLSHVPYTIRFRDRGRATNEMEKEEMEKVEEEYTVSATDLKQLLVESLAPASGCDIMLDVDYATFAGAAYARMSKAPWRLMSEDERRWASCWRMLVARRSPPTTTPAPAPAALPLPRPIPVPLPLPRPPPQPLPLSLPLSLSVPRATPGPGPLPMPMSMLMEVSRRPDRALPTLVFDLFDESKSSNRVLDDFLSTGSDATVSSV